MNEMEPDVLTIKEAARLLRTDRHKISKLIAEGVIPAISLGPKIRRIPRALLMKRLEAIALAGEKTNEQQAP